MSGQRLRAGAPQDPTNGATSYTLALFTLQGERARDIATFRRTLAEATGVPAIVRRDPPVEALRDIADEAGDDAPVVAVAFGSCADDLLGAGPGEEAAALVCIRAHPRGEGAFGHVVVPTLLIAPASGPMLASNREALAHLPAAELWALPPQAGVWDSGELGWLVGLWIDRHVAVEAPPPIPLAVGS